MSEYTPETLRGGINLDMGYGDAKDLHRWLDAHADAWEKREAYIEALEDAGRDAIADLQRSHFILLQEDGTRSDAMDLESTQRLAALAKPPK